MTKKIILQAKFSFLYLGVFMLLMGCGKSSVTPTPSKKWIVTTLAGSVAAGFKDGDSTQAQFNSPQSIVTDNNGNLYVVDIGNGSIRQVTYSGHVSVYAGNTIGSLNPGFSNIFGLARDSQGNLFTSEDFTFIRKIISPTNAAIFAGSLTSNLIDGTGTNAGFGNIANIVIDKQNNILVPDYDGNGIFHLRKVSPAGLVSTLTLQDNTGFSSNGTSNFHYQYAIAVDPSGNIYITGNANCLIKKIDASGNVTVLAGKGNPGFQDGKGAAALFNTILGMVCDASGNLFVCDSDNHVIRKVTSDGTVTTIAGTGMQQGYLNGVGSAAQFKYPFGITVDNSGALYVADSGNNSIRKLEYK